jgi:hypothetical protein
LLEARGSATADALRIADPAVGGGAFLLAALAVLREHGVDAVSAARALHGLDTDREAAALAQRAIAAAAGSGGAAVAAGDGLRDWHDGSFDAVLTNPPWETMQGDEGTAARVQALRPHFHHQGPGKLYTYRLFVERAVRLLRPGGRLGLIVPASLWFDRGAEPLRRLLLEHCDWQWLYGFENRRRVFPIDCRYRFGVVIATKGGRTDVVRVAFRTTDVAAWAADGPAHTAYGRDELRALSPHSGAFVEVEHAADLDLLRRMQRRSRPMLGEGGLGDGGLGEGGVFAWRQGDFNMTSARDRFVPRAAAEAAGHTASDDAVWRKPGAPDLLPLLQGAMVYDLVANHGAHAGGEAHDAAQRRTTWARASGDRLQPQFLVAADDWQSAPRDAQRTTPHRLPLRLVLRALSNATNERTAVACLVPDLPCGNSLGVLTPLAAARSLETLAAGAAVLSSLAFDWALRLRLAGTNLNGFVLRDVLWPRLDASTRHELAGLALRLSCTLPAHAAAWRLAHEEGLVSDGPAFAADERQRLYTRIDVLVGEAFGLTADDVAWITRGCGAETNTGRDTYDRGFQRLDRTLPAAERRPNRWLRAVTSSPARAPRVRP